MSDLFLRILVFVNSALAIFALFKALGGGRRKLVISGAVNAVMEPYRRGDYQAALEAAEGLRYQGELTHQYCFFRGTNLAHLGRLDEAEVWLRRCIAMREKVKPNRYLAIGYTSLGHVMLQAGRYDEAKECFEASMRTHPGRGSGYRSMAELFLLQRANPAEAARWAALAVERERTDRMITPELRRINTGEDLATLAWAAAAGGQSALEVRRLVTEAANNISGSSVSSVAQVHYHCGRAYIELGDRRTATEHFEHAHNSDPNGNWGRAAQTELSSSESLQ